MPKRAPKLGQNFLKSPATAAKIAATAGLTSTDIVLEVGPGKGILTEHLLQTAKLVIAVEKDRTLVLVLREKFKEEIASGRLILTESDILKFDPAQHGLKPHCYKIVANIPYYLTSRLIRIFLESDCPPSDMTLTLQKEVAERIVAAPPHMNILAVSVRAYGTPKIKFKIPRSEFSPAPKIDSAVIRIENISKKFFSENKVSEKKFFGTVRAGFSQKRKLLIGNLAGKKISSKENLTAAFARCGILPLARAENLEITRWACLCKNM